MISVVHYIYTLNQGQIQDFLEGWVDFKKKFENFVDLFFLDRPNWISEFFQSTKKDCFGQIFCAAGKIKKNRGLIHKTAQNQNLYIF